MRPVTLRYRRTASGFTLVEVTMAMGIFVFGIMGIAGLLLSGIQSEHMSIEQARAIETLREASAAVNSQQPVGTAGTTYNFQNGFPGGATNTALQWTYGGSIANLTSFAVPSPDNGGQVIFVRIVPPASVGQPVAAFLSVAWPSSATCSSTGSWSNAQGVQETYLSVMPPN